MGLDAGGEISVGLRVKFTDVYKKVRTRNCECEGQENNKFCSECGEEVWNEDEWTIKFKELSPSYLSEDGDDYYDSEVGKNQEFVIISGFYKSVDGTTGDDDEFKKLDIRVEEVREDIKRVTEPLGLWKEEEFGFWMKGWCSY